MFVGMNGWMIERMDGWMIVRVNDWMFVGRCICKRVDVYTDV
jgi:hypothetical protein